MTINDQIELLKNIMNSEIKNQTSRRQAIALLELVVAKNAAAIEHSRLTLQRQHDKQVNRLAELRLQKMLLIINTPKPEPEVKL
jgi:hypothetical protein